MYILYIFHIFICIYFKVCFYSIHNSIWYQVLWNTGIVIVDLKILKIKLNNWKLWKTENLNDSETNKN